MGATDLCARHMFHALGAVPFGICPFSGDLRCLGSQNEGWTTSQMLGFLVLRVVQELQEHTLPEVQRSDLKAGGGRWGGGGLFMPEYHTGLMGVLLVCSVEKYLFNRTAMDLWFLTGELFGMLPLLGAAGALFPKRRPLAGLLLLEASSQSHCSGVHWTFSRFCQIRSQDVSLMGT